MSLSEVHSRWVRGNLVYYQYHRKRIVDAIGQDVVKYVEDFINFPVDDSSGDPTAWTCTMVEAGTGNSTFASTNVSGGAGLITTDDNEDDGVSAQLNGESFKLKSTVDLYFGIFDVTISEATQSDFFAGLAITDTAILGGVTDRIGFQCLDGSTDIKFMLEKDSTETLSSSALGTLADATAVDLEFYFNGSTVEAFIDGASVETPAVTNLPDDEELRVSVEFLAGEALTPLTMQFDKIVCIQIGR